MHTFRFLLLLALAGYGSIMAAPLPILRAGATAVDISPTGFPVRVNAMFTERTATQIADPLYAKALALDDGTNRLVLCVVDTCMIPRALIDQAKAEASRATGIPIERMLVSATHTHSAPSAMGCLGSRVDPQYAAFLPARIAAALRGAVERLAPAQLGWAQTDDWEHTFNRRWIRRPDRMLTDPFGVRNVRAHMHPGNESPDAVGPSGPVDPQLSVLAVRHADGRPLAVLANYSQHYYGSPLVSSDYYGRFARHIARLLGADDSFVGIMSQGTSGDQMWMDYGAPARDIGYEAYARAIAERAGELIQRLVWQDTAPLRMAERRLELGYRTPDPARLEWARGMAERLGEKLPQTQPEIYALEAIYLHERPRTELKLQAIGIGDLGIAGWPNEVFALSGLKLKRRSPFGATFNIELANGAEGYIPPPEQHKLGGYTTWAARTAGLETNAEPRILENLVALLAEVRGRPARRVEAESGPYVQAVLLSKPEAYWRLEDFSGPTAHDAMGRHDAVFEDGIAFFLPGADGRRGYQPPRPPTPNAFSGGEINRAVHFAGGRLRAQIELGESYSIEMWIWNGLPSEARPVTGYFLSRGRDGDTPARGEHVGIGGTHVTGAMGKLLLFNGNERNELLIGRTILALRAWHQVVLVREGGRVRVHLDGRAEPEMAGEFTHTIPAGETSLFLGGRNDGLFGWEGKLDEASIFRRALGAEEINAHYAAAQLSPPVPAAPSKAVAASVPSPLDPAASLRKIHVREGYRVELMASEPLVLDPVAIDWDVAGRLWVVEMADYPLGLDGHGKPGGRVRILEDTDGDGRYDKQTLFAEGLTFPTGLLTWRDGVIVTAAPEILFLRDTDGDGRADVREVLVSGLTTGNQQLRVNGLRWGLDGWVYCAAGAHHGAYGAGTRLRTKRGEVPVGSRDFRLRPDTGELEAEGGPAQFGRNRDDWGHWFGTQNSRALWHYVLPDRYLRRNLHVTAPEPTRLVVTPLNAPVWPASSPEKRFHSFEQAGHFTSACSGMIYRDELLFPTTAQQSHAFTCEPFHNLVQHNVVTEDGVTFAAHRDSGEEQSDFFASEDRWCRPVMTRTGPDGALWVVDMYRYMIEHPDWLPAEGKAELLPHYRLGEDKGRLYRVFPEGRPPRRPLQLSKLSTKDLVGALDSPNEWQRDKAQMLLGWRADRTAIPALEELVTRSSHPLARVQALCSLDTLGVLRPELVRHALQDEHSGVRENALRLAESGQTPELIAAAAQLVTDPEPKVRLQLAFTLGTWSNQVAGEALGRLVQSEFRDPFMRAAILSSAVPHLKALVTSTQGAGAEAAAWFNEPLWSVALALEDRSSLATLLAPVFRSPDAPEVASQFEGVTRFLELLARRQQPVAALAEGKDPLALSLQRAVGAGPDSLFARARLVLAEPSRPSRERAAAAMLLARDEAKRREVLGLMAGLLTPQTAVDLQRTGVQALAATGDESVPTVLLERWSSCSPGIHALMVETLLSREAWAWALLEQMRQKGGIVLDPTQRARLLKHGSGRVRERAAQVLVATPSRAEVMAKLRPALDLIGDAGRGRAIFERVCITCHRLENGGGEVGPDLKSVREHSPERLLTSILDPSLDIQPGYAAYGCELSDGSELYGLMAEETGTSLTIKTADGVLHRVLRKEIVALRSANVSLMPEGLENGWSPQDLADLIQLLRGGP